MSSGVKGGASRVSIPSGVKKTIENIKEITGQNHSEDEIYAMLKECSMDPNETTQKLLLLDTFHEVKRKRDRRKENPNKEPGEKWKPGTQARANRVARGNYQPRYVSHDAGGGRNSSATKENAASHLTEKSNIRAPVAAPQDMKKSETSSGTSLITGLSNGPSGNTTQSANATAVHIKSEKPLAILYPVDSAKNLDAPRVKDIQQYQIVESSENAACILLASGSHLSSSDPLLLPSQDSPPPSAVGNIRREVGSQRGPGEMVENEPTGNKSSSPEILATSDVGIADIEQKMPNDLHKVGKNQHLESTQAPSSTVISVSSGSRPSSNYSNRSQVIGSQKVGPGKEWKPKSANPNVSQGPTAVPLSDVSTVSMGDHSESMSAPAVATSKEPILELQKKLEESHISESQHVIIPDHLHVPEVEKLGFCFGSFDASFALGINQNGLPDKCPSLSESSETIDEPVNDLELSNQSSTAAAEDTDSKYPAQPLSPSRGPDKLSSGEVEVSSSVTTDYNESVMEVAPGSQPFPVVHTSSNYGFGFVPPMLGSQLPNSDNSESQARDAPRLPGFVVPQSFDPASYYAQFYRPGMDGDGRISPFNTAGVANKYNGNAALVSAQTSQTPQELHGGVPLVLSTASPTPLATQAAGVMQSSIAATQQPLPIFRQPTGVHLSHYPPNYIPYGPYFSPFYVPPPTIHQFLSNGAFPQQPQAGNLYPTTPGAAAKYSAAQYKQGSNIGSSAPIAVPGNYGPYSLSAASYTSGSSPASVTSTSNEDISVPHPHPHVKKNNVYSSGQQNEGSGVWFTTPGRDISTLQASSFYNLPQGQLAFAPTQAGHGTFTGIFHPAQAVVTPPAVHHPLMQQSQGITNPADMVGPTGNVFQQQQQQQQQQHAQINWPNSY